MDGKAAKAQAYIFPDTLQSCRRADIKRRGLMKRGCVYVLSVGVVLSALSGGCGRDRGAKDSGCSVHEWQWEVLGSPACMESYEVQEICGLCGALGEKVAAGTKGHVWEDRVVSNGNCVDPKVISHVCSICKAADPHTVNYENRARQLHDYEAYSGSFVDKEYNAVIFYECDRCMRCGKEENRQQTGCEPLGKNSVGGWD